MDEEEHEVYGQEIPEDGDMDGADVDMAAAGDDATKVPPLDPCVYRYTLALGPCGLLILGMRSCRSSTR